jgi:hypothetical protein
MATVFQYDRFRNFSDGYLSVARYNTRTKELRVYFTNNPSWLTTFIDVPNDVWEEFVNSEEDNPVGVYRLKIKDSYVSRRDSCNDWTPLFIGLPDHKRPSQGNYRVDIAFTGYITVQVEANGIANAEAKASDVARLTLDCLEKNEDIRYSSEVIQVKRA